MLYSFHVVETYSTFVRTLFAAEVRLAAPPTWKVLTVYLAHQLIAQPLHLLMVHQVTTCKVTTITTSTYIDSHAITERTLTSSTPASELRFSRQLTYREVIQLHHTTYVFSSYTT